MREISNVEICMPGPVHCRKATRRSPAIDVMAVTSWSIRPARALKFFRTDAWCSEQRSSGCPTLAAEQNAMIAAGDIEVVNRQMRPVELRLQLIQRGRLELFVNLDRKQQFLIGASF